MVNSEYDALLNKLKSNNFKSINLRTGLNQHLSKAGELHWDDNCFALNVPTGIGPVIQVGQESLILVFNNTLSQIDSGKVVRPIGGTTNNFPHIEKAKADTHETIENSTWVTTMNIPAGESGFVTRFGKVNNLNTNAFVEGTVWLSGTEAGELTQLKPQFPNYEIRIGEIITKDAINGILGVAPTGDAADTVVNFWNGIFRETFDFRIKSDGTTITGTLTPADGHPDMTMIFSDGLSTLTTTPGATIELTPGTETNPQTSYVYILKSEKVLTTSLFSWPEEEHIKVANIAVRTPAIVKREGAIRNQNFNDAIEDTDTFQGHLSHIAERLRQEPAKWDSGIEGSVDIQPINKVRVKATAGNVYQLHKQPFQLLDMNQYEIDAVDQGNKTFTISDDGDLSSTFPVGRRILVNNSTGNDITYTVVATNFISPDFVITVKETIQSPIADGTIGDDIRVVNDFVSAYNTVLSLSDITTDASGLPLLNTSFSIVVWGVANKTGEESSFMANMPTGTFNKNFPITAVEDSTNQSVYDIPKQFQGVGFLIARFTFINTSGIWTLYDTEDLRGKVPNTIAGGGGGGTGVTTFTGLTDTPASYSGQAGKIPNVNATETALEFADAGAVSSVFTRTGVVIAATGDYTAAQVTNAFDKTVDDTDNINDSTSLNKFATAAELAEIAVNTAKVGVTTEIKNVVEDTTPQLGGDLDWNSNGNKLVSQTVAGSDGNAVYLSGANTWSQADASAEATASNMIAIRISATEVLTHGSYTTTGLTAGSIYYLSETTGVITTTAPSTSGTIVRIIGYALNATQLFVDPDKTYVEII